MVYKITSITPANRFVVCKVEILALLQLQTLFVTSLHNLASCLLVNESKDQTM